MTRKTTLLRIIVLFLLIWPLWSLAADPTATSYTPSECQGTSMPYPTPAVNSRVYPDSLTPIYIHHVGRHGSRFLSSSKYTTALMRHLDLAEAQGSLTKTGKELKKLCSNIIATTAGRWGALDSLGMAEQRAIASRTHQAFPMLFSETKVSALSSYVPRCVASMDEFTHQLTRLNNKIEIYTSSGRQNSPLMRPWSSDADYKAFMESEEWHTVYDAYFDQMVGTKIAGKIFGTGYTLDEGEARDMAINIYKVVAGCSAMGMRVNASQFFTAEEYNALWAVNNLHHYLTHSASTLSRAPMDMSARLLAEIVERTDMAASGSNPYAVELSFGHAETLMPLLALMRLQGCYYMTNYFDTVGLHWRDWQIVPMAANLQMVLFHAKSGRLYLRADLNEVPVSLIPGRDDKYVPWDDAKAYLTRCLPLMLQP